MKYMILLQGTQSDYDAMEGTASGDTPVWTRDDVQAMFGFMQKLNEELAATGEFLDGQGLSAPDRAAVVTSDENGGPEVSRNGYGTDHEVLVGYWLLECRSLERATQIAARIHTCPVPEGVVNHPVIVRPIDEEPPVTG